VEPVRIWLNRNYSTTVHLLELLRDNPSGAPVVLFGSHTDSSSPMLTGCDHRLREPAVTDPDFVDQVLELCVANRIDVFIPVAGQLQIARRAAEFAAVGTALVCPSAPAIELLADKAATYLALSGSELVPPWRVFRSLGEFDAAAADLDHVWTSDRPLILKPAVGVGADGVRFVSRDAPTLQDLLGPVGPGTDVAAVRAALAAAADTSEDSQGEIPPLLVMPYLPGPETSVDVLACGGRTLVAVPRSKNGRRRVIGGDPALPGLAAELIEHFRLDGLVNVQFRSFEGRPALLEINSRPSGGLFQTRLAGVNLPWAAVQVALGRDPGPLRPRLGAEYVTVPTAVLLNTAVRQIAAPILANREPVPLVGAAD
jgi:hypothetical protein